MGTWPTNVDIEVRGRIDVVDREKALRQLGRAIEVQKPGAGTDATGAGTDALTKRTTFYTVSGSGDCGGKPAWAGLVCKVGPAGQPSSAAVPTRFISSYSAQRRPTEVRDLTPSGVAKRTATTTYDNLGRVTSETVTTLGSGVDADTITTTRDYDDNTGLSETVAANGATITTGYDSWGRVTTYTDASGASSSTTYNARNQVATFNDGAGTYAYNYGIGGFVTSVDAGGGAGTFEYGYTVSGDVWTIGFPNGFVSASTYDELGTQTRLEYSTAGEAAHGLLKSC